MEVLNTIWLFFQDQILGMKWLNGFIGQGLSLIEGDLNSCLGGSVQFFLYDVIKITILLCLLIFFYFVYSKLLSARTKQENSRTFSWYRS